jgi:hypothetical protein
VTNFIFRWHGYLSRRVVDASKVANYEEVAMKPFFLVGPTNLSYDIQKTIVSLIRDLTFSAETSQSQSQSAALSAGVSHHRLCPLIIVSNERDQSHIVSIYASRKVPISQEPLDPIFSRFAGALSRCGVHLQTYASNAAGAGKSHSVRRDANAMNKQYVHVPINRGFTSYAVLIERMSCILQPAAAAAIPAAAAAAAIHAAAAIPTATTAIHAAAAMSDHKLSYCLHIDIASSVDRSFIKPLVELCVLGVLQDAEHSQRTLYIDSSNHIAIEVAAFLYDNVLRSHFQLYPVLLLKSSRESFVITREELRVGMGLDFDSVLYDGIIKSSAGATPAAEGSDAFVRLRYVSCALLLLRKRGGRFPFAMDCELIDECWAEVDGPTAYDLIASACQNQNQNRPDAADSSTASTAPLGSGSSISLWCIWSFINVLYWQLQEMHHPESPLNGCCLIDESREVCLAVSAHEHEHEHDYD